MRTYFTFLVSASISLTLSVSVASAQTFNVCLSLTPVISLGQQSGSVLSLQQFLAAKGFLDVTPTGYYGNKTYLAVAEYQASKGLEQVGQVGRLTSEAIRNETCSGSVFGGATVPAASAPAQTQTQTVQSTVATLSAIPTAPAPGDAIAVTFYNSDGSIQAGNAIAYCGNPSKIDMIPTSSSLMSGSSFILSRSKCVERGGKLWVPSSVNCKPGEMTNAKRESPISIESGRNSYEFRCTSSASLYGSATFGPAGQTTSSSASQATFGPGPVTYQQQCGYTDISGRTPAKKIEPACVPAVHLEQSKISMQGCIISVGQSSCKVGVSWMLGGEDPSPNVEVYYGGKVTFLGNSSNSNGVKEVTIVGPTAGISASMNVTYTYGASWVSIGGSNSVATTCEVGSAWNGAICASAGGAVFGPGPGGVPGSQPVTYGWVAYAGSMLGQQSPTNLGWSEPSTPCTQANAGATYYLGVSSSGQQVVATCNPSNQGVTSFGTVNETTINAPGQTTSSGSVPSGGSSGSGGVTFGATYAGGNFTNESGQAVEWACGNANVPAPPGSGWVPQESGCFHRIVQ